MRYAMRILGPAIVLSMAVALTGCGSMALKSMGDGFSSDLVPGTTPAPAVGTARFFISGIKCDVDYGHNQWTFSFAQAEWKEYLERVRSEVKAMSARANHFFTQAQWNEFVERLRSEAMSARPNLFSDDISAVQLFLVSGSSGAGNTMSMTMSIRARTPEGEESLGSVAYKYHYDMRSGKPADKGTPAWHERVEKGSRALYIEAVVKALGQCDAAKLAKLQAICDSRKSRIQSLSLDGKPCWGWVGYGYSKPGASSGPRDVAYLYFSTQALTYKTCPAVGVVVARLGEDGRWRPCNGYLRKTQTLTAASVLLENGKPGRVVLRPVEEPELEDFIDLPAAADEDCAETIRWSNGVLLQVKNRSLPRLVRERSRTELLDLATRMEKVALDMDQWVTKCKDSAQQMVEQGRGDPAPAREWATLCRQRIEVLGAILATIKQAAAQKKP